MTIKLTSAARNAVRSAVTASAGWDSYRRLNNISSADLSGDRLLAAAAACGVDVATVAANADANDDERRPHDETAVAALQARFEAVRDTMPERDSAFCASVFLTIIAKGGRATSRQFETVTRAIEKAENKAAAASTTTTTTTTTNAAPVYPFETVPLAPVAPTTAAGNDAGAALAALVAPYLVGNIESTLKGIIDKAVSTIPTVRIEIAKANGEFKTVKGATHPKLPTLLKAAACRGIDGNRLNVWLSGPTATGKTHAAKTVADALDLPFYSHGAMAMTHELMGYCDGNGNYHATSFRKAFEFGGVCILDEVDSYEAQPTLALNAALANGYASFPDGMVKRHADCLIIAAGNTSGNGATADFVGRNKLDAAFLSRFAVKIDWHRDTAFELAIGGDESFTRRVQAARERAKIAGLKHNIDTRHAQAGAALIAQGFTPDEAADLTYLAGLNSDQRRMVEGLSA